MFALHVPGSTSSFRSQIWVITSTPYLSRTPIYTNASPLRPLHLHNMLQQEDTLEVLFHQPHGVRAPEGQISGHYVRPCAQTRLFCSFTSLVLETRIWNYWLGHSGPLVLVGYLGHSLEEMCRTTTPGTLLISTWDTPPCGIHRHYTVYSRPSRPLSLTSFWDGGPFRYA